MKKAEITVFLSLIFILLVSFVGSVIDVTSLQIAKSYRRMEAERAIECVFAEYQKELLEEYDVFALDIGYESGNPSDALISKRMEYYGLVNSNNLIESIKFLSDNKGEVFYQQVMKYMEHKYGIDYIKDALNKTEIWKQQEEKYQEYQKDDPITYVDGLKDVSILTLVMPEGKTVSEKTLPLQELPSYRELNAGYGDFPSEKYSETEGKLLFTEYILEHFSSAVDEPTQVMDYEIEYLLGGKGSDRENLKAVVQKLLVLRFAANYTYLQSSPEKQAQAEAMALTLGAVAAAPGAVPVLSQGILLAWAAGESVVDIRTLLGGKRVPLVKTGTNWQLSISSLMKLGENGDIYDGQDVKDGMKYEDYLRMLLYLEKKEHLSMRCLDLIELNLKEIHGLSFFRADLCATKMRMECMCSFRRGITYTFPVSFAYQ